MPMRSAHPPAVGLVMLTAACVGEPAVPQLFVAAAAVKPLRVTAEKQETMDDTIGFHATTDILRVPSGYLVVDGGNDRLVLLSPDLQPDRVLGSSGSGPGELETPLTADRTGDQMAVLEMTNTRISFFRLDGTFADVVALPTGVGDLAIEASGSALVAAAPPTEFLTRIERNGSYEPFATRPTDPASGANLGGPVRNDKVAVTSKGTVLVLDNTAGYLHAFSTDGRLLRSASLPEHIVDDLHEQNEAMKAAFARQGRRVLGAGLVKSMKTQPNDHVLILLSAPPVFGLMIDPETFEASVLSVPEEPGRWEPLLNAVSGVVEDQEITVLHSFGVTRYHLSEVP